jgi:benzylsuccinate CoA-transferase BbsF subunit
VVENFFPGQMQKWKLDYESLKKINPGLIMFSASTQGQTGPHARVPGMGVHLMGSSGFVQLICYPDRDPLPLPIAYTDSIGPRFGMTVLAAALAYREKTGVGQYLDLSQFEASLHFIGPPVLDYEVNGRIANRMGNASSCGAPHGVYQCQGDDRWCAIAVFTEDEWQRFCLALGSPAWTARPEYSTMSVRKENEEGLNSLVADWCSQRPPEEVMELLQGAGVAAGIVATGKDVFEDPQLIHRNCWWTLDHGEIGPFRHLGQTAILSRTPARGYRPAPCLGEHTEMVCRQILGMTQPDYDDLKNSGMLELE